jgi:hypothetical protein
MKMQLCQQSKPAFTQMIAIHVLEKRTDLEPLLMEIATMMGCVMMTKSTDVPMTLRATTTVTPLKMMAPANTAVALGA